MSTSIWLRIGAIWGFLAVAIGAFGAHGLKDRFKELGDQFGTLATERPEGIFQTATHYHMYCASRWWRWVYWPRTPDVGHRCKLPDGRCCSVP